MIKGGGEHRRSHHERLPAYTGDMLMWESLRSSDGLYSRATTSWCEREHYCFMKKKWARAKGSIHIWWSESSPFCGRCTHSGGVLARRGVRYKVCNYGGHEAPMCSCWCKCHSYCKNDAVVRNGYLPHDILFSFVANTIQTSFSLQLIIDDCDYMIVSDSLHGRKKWHCQQLDLLMVRSG